MSADNAGFFLNTVIGGRVGDTFKQVPAANRSFDVIDNNFNEQGLTGGGSQNIFYEPNISKPIRGTRQLTISFNVNEGKLEGIPKVWRELLSMPEQKDEVEEIDETLEINKRKLDQIEKAAAENNFAFEVVEVIKPRESKMRLKRKQSQALVDGQDALEFDEEGTENYEPEYNRDREEEEERPSYVIRVYNKTKRDRNAKKDSNGLLDKIKSSEIEEEEIQ